MKLIVNGLSYDWPGGLIAYADIVTMAYPGEPESRVIPHPLSVTYSWDGPVDIKRQGTLSPVSEPIWPAEGMIFNAYNTGSA